MGAITFFPDLSAKLKLTCKPDPPRSGIGFGRNESKRSFFRAISRDIIRSKKASSHAFRGSLNLKVNSNWPI